MYKIGEVACLLATSVRSIRYYEEESLLKPIRTDGGTRLYSDAHVERLKAILHLARTGFSIESIRAIGDAREKCNTGNESSNTILNLLDEALANIENQLKQLGSLKREITSAKGVVRFCSGCENVPSTKGCPGCPVRAKLSDIGLLNLIWDNGL